MSLASLHETHKHFESIEIGLFVLQILLLAVDYTKRTFHSYNFFSCCDSVMVMNALTSWHDMDGKNHPRAIMLKPETEG